MRYPSWCVLTLAGVLSFAGTVAAETKFSATASASSGTRNIPGPTDYQSAAGTVAQSFTASSSQTESTGSGADIGTGTGRSNSSASAGPGALHLQTSAAGLSTVSGNGVMTAIGGGYAGGSIDDAFTIHALNCLVPALCGDGALGVISFSTVANGSAGGNGSSAPPSSWTTQGSWSASFSITTGFFGGATLPASAEWTADYGQSRNSAGLLVETQHGALGTNSYILNFVFGMPINLHFAGALTASAQASGSAEAAFAANFANTIGWAGISDVTDVNGNGVEFSAISSGSGANYASALVSSVPEPSSLAMMMGGLVVILVRRGITRRRSAS